MVDGCEEEVVRWNIAVVGQGRFLADGARCEVLGPGVACIDTVDNVSGKLAEVFDKSLIHAVADENHCLVGQGGCEHDWVYGLLGRDGSLGVR